MVTTLENVPIYELKNLASVPRLDLDVKTTPHGGRFVQETHKGWERGDDISLEARVRNQLPSQVLHKRVGHIRLGMANGDPIRRNNKIGIHHASGYSEDVALLTYTDSGVLGVVVDGRHDKEPADIIADEFSGRFVDRLSYLRAEYGDDVSPLAAIHYAVLSLDDDIISSRVPQGPFFSRFQRVQEEKGIAPTLSASATIGVFFYENYRGGNDGTTQVYTFDTGDCLTFWSAANPTKADRMQVLRSKDSLRLMESREGAVIGDPARPLLHTAFHSAAHGVHTEARSWADPQLQPAYEALRKVLMHEYLRENCADPESVLDDPSHPQYQRAALHVQSKIVREMTVLGESLRQNYFFEKYGRDAVDIDFSKLYPAMRYKIHKFQPGTRLVLATDGILPNRLNLPLSPDAHEERREMLYNVLTRQSSENAMEELLRYAYDGSDNSSILMVDF